MLANFGLKTIATIAASIAATISLENTQVIPRYLNVKKRRA